MKGRNPVGAQCYHRPEVPSFASEPTSMPFRMPKSGIAQSKEFWKGYAWFDDTVVDL